MVTHTNDEIEKASKIIENIISSIEHDSGISSDFKFKTMDIENFDDDLLNSEFFEYSNNLASKSAEALENFYSPILDKKKKEKLSKASCERFKNEIFNGNPDSNILLKYFLIKKNPKGLIWMCLKG